jgi:DNA-binding CsgD family transcriptional regulator
MSSQKSTPEEIAACAALVSRTEEEIARLVAAGKKVHIIWDVDHVLVSGRSDDVFAALGYSVPKYFQYEERLMFERLEDGPWARLARRGQHQTQDIVTARSSYLSLRVTYWLLEYRTTMRWQLFVGHQSKADSYRIILESFKKDPEAVVYMIDDGAKNVDAFNRISAELGLSDRTVGILAPQIRRYDEAEIRAEAEAVIGYAGNQPCFVTAREYVVGEDMGRHPLVVPNPLEAMRDAIRSKAHQSWKEGIVERHRATLEAFADDMHQPKDTDTLFFLYELLKEPR